MESTLKLVSRFLEQTKDGNKVMALGMKDPANIATSLMFNLPIGLRVKLEEIAEEKDVTVAALVRSIVAENVGYKLVVGEGRARKYASEEEKKEAQARKNKARRDKVNKIMELYRKGTLDMDALSALQADEEDDEE